MKKFLMEGKKVGGYVLLETVLAMIAFSMLSMAFFTIFSGQFSMINSSADAMQAQQYAEIDAQQLRLMNYYDLEDEGAKSRSAMTSWSNPDNLWEDEITIGNEIIIDDYTESKQRIATVKIYRQGDTLARFSMEVPLSSQNSGGGVPIGGIVAWGTDTNPQYDGGTYLECDGSTFDRNKFKRLYEVLGTNTLPNYQGMFLRGHGKQAVADDRARKVYAGTNHSEITISEVTHKSADKVGEIQFDSLRPMYGYLGNLQWGITNGHHSEGYQNSGNLFHFMHSPTHIIGAASYPHLSGNSKSSPYILNDIAEAKTSSDLSNATGGKGWYEALTKKEYSFSKSYATDENGNRFLSDIEIEVQEIHPILDFDRQIADFYFDAESAMPVDNEIRPANVAVKFMLKAK